MSKNITLFSFAISLNNEHFRPGIGVEWKKICKLFRDTSTKKVLAFFFFFPLSTNKEV